MTDAKVTVCLNVEEDNRTLFNAVRSHARFAESWRDNVINGWSANDDHDPDQGGACNFEVASMTELRELVKTFEQAKIRRWHLWVSIETEAIHANGGLGFRSDDDIMGSISVKWDKLDNQARVAVAEAINTLQAILR